MTQIIDLGPLSHNMSFGINKLPPYCPLPWRSHLGGGDIEMLGICASVRACMCQSMRPSVTKRVSDNFKFHGPIYTIFDPVMHTTIALDEFEAE